MNQLPINPIQRLQETIAKLPQAELVTRHYFADGMYARELELPKGMILVGKVHKKEHFFILTRGKLSVVDAVGSMILKAGAILSSKPGTKRAGFAHEDSVCVTIHKTVLTNLDEIEEELVEYDPNSPYGVGNELKKLVIEGEFK